MATQINKNGWSNNITLYFIVSRRGSDIAKSGTLKSNKYRDF